MEQRITITIIVCIVLLIYLLNTYHMRKLENEMLKGFWKADAQFCTSAGLKTFLVQITDDNNGYIIVENDDGLIINNPVIFELSGVSISPTICDCREYNLTINWLGEKGYQSFFPTKQRLYYYPLDGKLVFSDAKQVYAVLYKDHSISDLANKMPEHVMLEKKSNSSKTTPSEDFEDL